MSFNSVRCFRCRYLDFFWVLNMFHLLFPLSSFQNIRGLLEAEEESLKWRAKWTRPVNHTTIHEIAISTLRFSEYRKVNFLERNKEAHDMLPWLSALDTLDHGRVEPTINTATVVHVTVFVIRMTGKRRGHMRFRQLFCKVMRLLLYICWYIVAHPMKNCGHTGSAASAELYYMINLWAVISIILSDPIWPERAQCNLLIP